MVFSFVFNTGPLTTLQSEYHYNQKSRRAIQHRSSQHHYRLSVMLMFDLHGCGVFYGRCPYGLARTEDTAARHQTRCPEFSSVRILQCNTDRCITVITG